MENFKMNLKEIMELRRQVVELQFNLPEKQIVGVSKMMFVPLTEEEELFQTNCEFVVQLNAKQITIKEVTLIEQDLTFSYPSVEEQASLNQRYFSPIRDLNSLNAIQRIAWEMELEGNLSITIPDEIWKDAIKEEKCINLKITYELNDSLCGIRYENYFDYQSTTLKQYVIVDDLYGYSKYWMPCIEDLKSVQHWTLKLTAPSEYFCVSSGKLQKITERKSGNRTFKYTTATPFNCSKIGFVVAPLACASLQDHPLIFYFGISKKTMEAIEKYLIPSKMIKEIIEIYELYLSAKFPSELKIVFLPNLGVQLPSTSAFHQSSLTIKHAELILVDERLIHNSNIIEYRYKTYELLAEALAYKYIGETIFEQNYSDYWLFLGLRTTLAKLYKIQRCGAKIHRYHIMKQMSEFIKDAKCGLDQLPLCSNCYSNPAELQLSRSIFLKSRLMFHMIECTVGESTLKKMYIMWDRFQIKQQYFVSLLLQ